jgi:hypothetical protein
MTDWTELEAVLDEALQQACQGKGLERHGSGLPLSDQPIMSIPRMQGSMDGLIFQAVKKALEAKRIHELHGADRAICELLGSINYLAAACLWLKDKNNAGGEIC